jgi:pyruvate kinase
LSQFVKGFGETSMPKQKEKTSRELPVPIDSFDINRVVSSKKLPMMLNQIDFWASIAFNIQEDQLESLMVQNGISAIRMNISKFSSSQELLNKIQMFHRIKEKRKLRTGLVLDTGGSKARVAKFVGSNNQNVLDIYQEETIAVFFPHSQEDSRAFDSKGIVLSHTLPSPSIGTVLFISDGWQQLKVVKVEKDYFICSSLHDAQIHTKRGVSYDSMYTNLELLTPQDEEYLHTVLTAQIPVDYIGVSFVRNSNDINVIKDQLRAYSIKPKVIAKIELIDAINSIDSILDLSDGIMIARGDLAVNVASKRMDMLEVEDNLRQKATDKQKLCVIATRVADSLEQGANELDFYEKFRLSHELQQGNSLTLMLANETVDSSNAIKNYHMILQEIKNLISE